MSAMIAAGGCYVNFESAIPTSMEKNRRKQVFDLEGLLSYKVSTLYNRIQAGTTRQLAGGALATREWRVLALLAKLEPVSASELVARSPMDKASVSRAVANLVERDLISISADLSDRRVQQLELTASGRKLFERIALISLARHRDLLKCLTPAERRAAFAILDKLIARAEALLVVSPGK